MPFAGQTRSSANHAVSTPHCTQPSSSSCRSAGSVCSSNIATMLDSQRESLTIYATKPCRTPRRDHPGHRRHDFRGLTEGKVRLSAMADRASWGQPIFCAANPIGMLRCTEHYFQGFTHRTVRQTPDCAEYLDRRGSMRFLLRITVIGSGKAWTGEYRSIA